jgi:hypothetical protein
VDFRHAFAASSRGVRLHAVVGRARLPHRAFRGNSPDPAVYQHGRLHDSLSDSASALGVADCQRCPQLIQFT